ncbi:glycoside hydrolase family 95 protein [Pisolithus tinctorius]|nr:glycoside hydrolase family 95 protein [Pisolithus tinctorius]
MDSPIALLGGRPWAVILPLFRLIRRVLPQDIQLWLSQISCILSISTCASVIRFAPSGFPDSGNGLWYTSPGTKWAHDLLPIGNGHLAAMLPGGTTQESIQLNIESLWSGGPFQDPTYNGGNNLPSQRTQLAEDMQRIRQTIFSSPSGTIDNIAEIMTPAGAYGSYAGAGYILVTMNTTGLVSGYVRWLDLDTAVQRTMWSQKGVHFVRESFCSHPLQACVQHINTTASTLPTLTYAYSVAAETGLPLPNITCFDSSTLRIRNVILDPGMLYEILVRVEAPGGKISCTANASSSPSNATLIVTHASEAWVTWFGDTDYDIAAGDSTSNFSFQGPDPHNNLIDLMSSVYANTDSYTSILDAHISDYVSLTDRFSISLGQTPDFKTPTDQIVASYRSHIGNPYLEWLLFNYGRYLLVSSARGILPANLQGKWADAHSNAWGSDYHSNINIQMNYWFAEMANLDVTRSLFDYFENTWVPRGRYTAEILYNVSRGWVTHNEMNIFGHTGMKLSGNSALWANYPESNAWMMIHIWDHLDYTNDVKWWRRQGWPLLKGAASFHLEKLVEDLHFNDTTLVTVPCNSPEQTPITFGCAHSQQLIWQMFNAVEKGFVIAGDSDIGFLDAIRTSREKMDMGLRIGRWGQLQEWKVDIDQPTDTHRHLSHLIGLYPGYAIASYSPSLQGGLTVGGTFMNYTKKQVLDAAEISLIHRGNGTGPDADAGWEKVWRAAAWAQLGNGTEFYKELTYAIERNFAQNLFSLYTYGSTIFQIDANFGYPAAVLNALIQAPDVASMSIPLEVTLLPALPLSWSSGSVRGARIRGGITLDLSWKRGKPNMAKFTVDDDVAGQVRDVNVNYAGRVVGRFRSNPGTIKNIRF